MPQILAELGLEAGDLPHHSLKRQYEDEEHPFGWMQDGIFELFDQERRLYCWRTEEDLVDATAKLP